MQSILLASILTCSQLIDIAKTVENSDFLTEFQKTEIILKLREYSTSCPLIYREFKK
jgi:hypothetical protein